MFPLTMWRDAGRWSRWRLISPIFPTRKLDLLVSPEKSTGNPPFEVDASGGAGNAHYLALYRERVTRKAHEGCDFDFLSKRETPWSRITWCSVHPQRSGLRSIPRQAGPSERTSLVFNGSRHLAGNGTVRAGYRRRYSVGVGRRLLAGDLASAAASSRASQDCGGARALASCPASSASARWTASGCHTDPGCLTGSEKV